MEEVKAVLRHAPLHFDGHLSLLFVVVVRKVGGKKKEGGRGWG